MNTAQLVPQDVFTAATLRLATAAYLARFKGQSRVHTESDLRAFFGWCQRHNLDPMTAQRAHVELFLRWMQETAGYRPSTVSRRLSVVAGFFRTCVIDGVLEHSPAEYVRRPHVSPESPTLGLTHLQFEAMLSAGRDSGNINDFALVSMLGLLGLRIFEATGVDIESLDEVHGHRVLRVLGKGDKPALVRCHLQSGERSTVRSTAERPGPCCAAEPELGWTGTARPADSAPWPTQLECTRLECTRTCSDTLTSRPCSTPVSISATSR